MSKNFEAKKVVVSEIEEKIEKAESIVIVEYKALTVMPSPLCVRSAARRTLITAF